MSYGLQVLNDTGDVVIAEGYRNHVIVASGSVSVSADGVLRRIARIGLSSAIPRSRSPLLWVRLPDTSTWAALLTYEIDGSGNVSGFYVTARNPGPIGPGWPGGTVTIDYRVTALPSGASADTWGLRVYDAAGDVAFDSGYDYLAIVEAQSKTVLTDATPWSFTHASVSGPWYCLSALAVQVVVSPSGDDSQCQGLGVRNVSATQTEVDWVEWFYTGGDIAWLSSAPPGPRSLVIAS